MFTVAIGVLAFNQCRQQLIFGRNICCILLLQCSQFYTLQEIEQKRKINSPGQKLGAVFTFASMMGPKISLNDFIVSDVGTTTSAAEYQMTAFLVQLYEPSTNTKRNL